MLPRGHPPFTSPSSSQQILGDSVPQYTPQLPSVSRTRTEMCNNNAPHLRPTSMIDTSHATVPVKPAPRRIRTRTRKPKFLSLRLELSPPAQMAVRHQQLNLFPLHPENLVDTHDDNVNYLLDTDGDGCATLTGLLDGATTASSEQESPSLSYAYRDRDRESEEGGDAMLVRTAMKRSKERQVSEEKWVCYSEVVEKKEEEVTSCSAGPSWWCPPKTTPRSLSLKLDYQQVLAAWSDKGSLYIEGPQTVPDLHHDDFLNDSVSANSTKGVIDSWGSVGNLWTVPERRGDISGVKLEEDGGKEGCSTKLGQREASVLRYKEKRQNRLFSKRIRYEVRKLNAEKRPRMKGRFVKRN